MARGKRKIPNPGSDAAIKCGCNCPVLDNNHGAGCGWGPGLFWQVMDCPLHGIKTSKKSRRPIAADCESPLTSEVAEEPHMPR